MFFNKDFHIQNIISFSNSGMQDKNGTALLYEEIIKITGKVTGRAHAAGITVEGELGRLVGKETYEVK